MVALQGVARRAKPTAHSSGGRRYAFEHFGHVVNLVLTLSTATLGFAANLAIERRITWATYGSYLFVASLVFLFLAVGAGLLTNWTRLCDYRYTALAARGRELHNGSKQGSCWTKMTGRKLPVSAKARAIAPIVTERDHGVLSGFSWGFLRLEFFCLLWPSYCTTGQSNPIQSGPAICRCALNAWAHFRAVTRRIPVQTNRIARFFISPHCAVRMVCVRGRAKPKPGQPAVEKPMMRYISF